MGDGNDNQSVRMKNSQESNNKKIMLSDFSDPKPISEVGREQIILSHSKLNENGKKSDLEEGTKEVSNVSKAEKQIQNLPFPKSVYLIIANNFFNTFSYYGVISFLVLYLTRQLGYNNNDATIIYHIFIMLSFFLSILGGIISDSWLGKYKTILYFTFVFMSGLILISIGAIPTLNLSATTLTIIGLMLIALGVGGVQPCIPAFGGDQFKMPEQAKQITIFFTSFYLSMNCGALLSFTVIPILREDINCFGEKQCNILAFGVPFLVLAISIFVLILGRPLFKLKPPAGNMIVLVSKTIGNAIATKWKENKINPREHWLDYADKKYDRLLIEDIKVLMRVLVLYLPLPIFWALFHQQGSRWIIQATRMNGDMGSWDIKPDQMQMLNPLLVITFIPLCEMAIYPALKLVNIHRPLQKLTLGGILAGMAFVVSGALELKLEQTYPTLPTAGLAQLRVYNGELCNYSVSTNLAGLNFNINSLDLYVNKNIKIGSTNGLEIQFEFNKESSDCPTLPRHKCLLEAEKSYYLFLNSKNITHPVICDVDTIAKPSRGYPLGRTLANVNPNAEIKWENSKGSLEHTELAYERNLTELKSDTYRVYIDGVEVETVKLEVGGIYTVLIAEKSPGKYQSKSIIVTNPNSISILWLIPQFIVISLGEVMFSVTGFEFSYSQAPESMKSVLQSCWLLTISFGNIIMAIIAELSLLDSQANEFFLFAGLMFGDMLIFMIVAYRYKPNNPNPKCEAEA